VDWWLSGPELQQIAKGKPGKAVFLEDMSDLYHDEVPDDWLDRIFAAASQAPHTTYQVLTKRPTRMHAYWSEPRRADALSLHAGIPVSLPLPHLWHGVSLEKPDYLWRADILRETPATKRFLSCEPLLGNLGVLNLEDISWVIIGGESGSGHRGMNLAWMQSIAVQCLAAGVPLHIKQDSGYRDGLQGRIPDDLWVYKSRGEDIHEG